MVKVNGEQIKNRTHLESMIANNSFEDIYVDDICELNKLLKIKQFDGLTAEIFIRLCKISYLCKRSFTKIVLDLDEINDTFDIERYEKYLAYRIENKYANTVESYVLKHGEEKGLKLRDVSINLSKKINTPYRIEYWLNKGFNELEAANKILEYKKNKATSLDGFIKRHGFVDGVNKFEVFQNTSKHTRGKYMELYGELGEEKWLEYVNKKKYNSVFRKEYWVNKGYSEVESEEKRKEFHVNNLNTSSVQYWVSKGLNTEDAINKVYEIYDKKQVKFRNASKASLKIFQKVINEIKKLNLSYKIGVKGNGELALYSSEHKKLYYYDFTIPELKLIFEYHGEKFHPHHSIKSDEDLLEWTTFYLVRDNDKFNKEKKTGLDIRNIDEHKRKLAIENGYKYFVIWSSDNKEDAVNNIINIIKSEKK
jgi:ribosomal protein S16